MEARGTLGMQMRIAQTGYDKYLKAKHTEINTEFQTIAEAETV
jgi:hypothetical protein